MVQQQHIPVENTDYQPNYINDPNHAASQPTPSESSTQSQHETNRQHLGHGTVPELKNIRDNPMKEGIESQLHAVQLNTQQLVQFMHAYHQHCGDILRAVEELNIEGVEECWRTFWLQEDEFAATQATRRLEKKVYKHTLTFSSFSTTPELNQQQLYSLCTLTPVHKFMTEMDEKFYQVLIDILMPSVLRQIPSTLTQTVRSFAKRLESGLSNALRTAPPAMRKIKVSYYLSVEKMKQPSDHRCACPGEYSSSLHVPQSPGTGRASGVDLVAATTANASGSVSSRLRYSVRTGRLGVRLRQSARAANREELQGK